MMNIVAIAFIFSSIAAASFFSSPPVPAQDHQIPQSSSFAPISSEANDEPLDAASVLSQTPKAKTSSVFTDAKNKASQFEESTADALKSVAERVAHKSAQIEESVSKIDEEILESAGNIDDMAAAATREIRRNLNEIIERAWELGQDAGAFVSAGAAEAARSAAAVAHLLGFATAYGTCVWVTFASNHVLASVLPRQQLGIVQSRIYPVYFRFLAVAVGVGLAGHILNGKERVQGYNLMAILGIVLLNLIWLEPKATKAMFESMKLEKEEGRGRDVADVSIEPTNTPVVDALATGKEVVKGRMSELRKRLKNLNNYSSFLNVLTLMGLSWHLVYLA